MQAQTWKNNQGTAFLIFACCSERLLQFEKAISKVICQTNVFMQLKARWELDECYGMLMLFHVLYVPEVKLVQIKNVPPGGYLIAVCSVLGGAKITYYGIRQPHIPGLYVPR